MVGDHGPSVERELGALSANVAILIASEATRGRELERLSADIREIGVRISAIEVTITAMAGPVADFQAFRLRAGYFWGGVALIVTVFGFFFGAPFRNAVLKALGFPHD